MRKNRAARKIPGWITALLTLLLGLAIAVMLLSYGSSPEDAVTLHRAPPPTPTASPTPMSTDAPSPAPADMPTDVPALAVSGRAVCTYVLNTNTMKFHAPGCSSVNRIKEKNRSDFTGPREELLRMGYEPCGVCKP